MYLLVKNLYQALEDKGLDLPTKFPPLVKRSSLLIEDTDTINMGKEDNQKNMPIPKTLTDQEKKNSTISFLKEIQINFSWSYADMPSLDLELVVHTL